MKAGRLASYRGERIILFDFSPGYLCIYPPGEEREREKQGNWTSINHRTLTHPLHCTQNEGREREEKRKGKNGGEGENNHQRMSRVCAFVR